MTASASPARNGAAKLAPTRSSGTVQVIWLSWITHPLLTGVAAFAAGVLNAIAGGGSFLSFPTLLFLGMPSVAANATNTTLAPALVPTSETGLPSAESSSILSSNTFIFGPKGNPSFQYIGM